MILASLLVAVIAVASGPSPAPAIAAADAARIFATAHARCLADAGRLWGVSLCVPMMIADPNTHQAVPNVVVSGSTRDGDVFRLTLPADAAISTAPRSTTAYAGRRSCGRWPDPPRLARSC
ncbi:MAG: hypothetical protein ABI231_10900 [Candidatus Tumulicola sp.]